MYIHCFVRPYKVTLNVTYSIFHREDVIVKLNSVHQLSYITSSVIKLQLKQLLPKDNNLIEYFCLTSHMNNKFYAFRFLKDTVTTTDIIVYINFVKFKVVISRKTLIN